MIALATVPTLSQIGFNLDFIVTNQVGTVVDISTASLKQLKFTPPSGVEITKTAAFITTGTDGGLRFVSDSGFLSAVGAWRVRAHVVVGSLIYDTPEETFLVRGQ